MRDSLARIASYYTQPDLPVKPFPPLEAMANTEVYFISSRFHWVCNSLINAKFKHAYFFQERKTQTKSFTKPRTLIPLFLLTETSLTISQHPTRTEKPDSEWNKQIR